MLIHFKNILETEFTDLKEKEIFLALSGGKDSMALSHLLLQCGYKHTLLHCNFKLRGVDSDLDEKFVLDYANKHNLPIFTQSFNTKKLATTLNLTIQQTARKLRYDWFDTFVVHPNQVLLSAHHLSDSIETFFINLMRGTSIKGLGGISQKRGYIRRPLHNFTSEQIQNYITQNKILFREDSSNAENKYLRNNLRNNVIPSFNSITSNFTQKMGRTMHSLNALTQWVEKQAVIFKKTHFKNSGNIIAVDLNTLKIQDPAFLEFIVADFDIHRSNLANFIHFLNAQTGAQYFTQSHCFTVNRSLLLIEPNQPLNQPYQQTVLEQNLPTTFQTPWVKLAFTPSKTIKPFERNGETLQFDIEKIKFPLLIRNWKKGDRIQPLGMMGTKLISAILIDKKISIAQKKHTLVLVDAENTLLALIGHTIADPFKITNQTQAFLLVNTVH